MGQMTDEQIVAMSDAEIIETRDDGLYVRYCELQGDPRMRMTETDKLKQTLAYVQRCDAPREPFACDYHSGTDWEPGCGACGEVPRG